MLCYSVMLRLSETGTPSGTGGGGGGGGGGHGHGGGRELTPSKWQKLLTISMTW